MNAAEIRKLIAEHDMAALDKLEQEVYASMDDDANDVAELGDRLTNILGAKRVLEKLKSKTSSPRSPCERSSRTYATSSADPSRGLSPRKRCRTRTRSREGRGC